MEANCNKGDYIAYIAYIAYITMEANCNKGDSGLGFELRDSGYFWNMGEVSEYKSIDVWGDRGIGDGSI